MDASVVDTENIDLALTEMARRAKDFPPVELSSFQSVHDENFLPNFRSVLPEQLRGTHGIESVVLAKDARTEETILYVALNDDMRFGSPFTSRRGTPYPAFISAVDEIYQAIAGANGYTPKWKDPDSVQFQGGYIPKSPLKGLLVRFNVRERDLVGHDFIVHLNAGLFASKQGDLNAYTLPLKFSLVSRGQI